MLSKMISKRMQIRSLKILNSLDSRKKERASVEIKKHNYVHVHGSTTYDHQRPMPASAGVHVVFIFVAIFFLLHLLQSPQRRLRRPLLYQPQLQLQPLLHSIQALLQPQYRPRLTLRLQQQERQLGTFLLFFQFYPSRFMIFLFLLLFNVHKKSLFPYLSQPLCLIE